MTSTANLPPTITDAAATTMYSWVVTALGSGKYCGYCTISDVQTLAVEIGNNPSSFDDKNVVARAIVDSALELQGILNEVYVMPYAGSDAQILGRLSEFNSKFAAALMYERQMAGISPDQALIAANLRSYVMQQLADIKTGAEPWYSPWGDATARAALPAYTKASLALASTVGADEPTFQYDCFVYSKPVI